MNTLLLVCCSLPITLFACDINLLFISNATFTSQMEIFASHDSFYNRHDIKLEDNFNNLPTIHWLPKIYKRL